MEKKKSTRNAAKKTTKAVTKKETSPKKVETKSTLKKKRKKKRGFTLIELLAVIIILGILMIIAIPSVTKYISDSRKSAYVDTAKQIVGSTRNQVNEGKLGMYDTNTTYYIPASYIKTENASKSPYGEFTQAYVGVIYNGTGYKYYWISTDDTGQGVKNITLSDKLDTDDIVSDLKASDIENTVKTIGIGSRTKIKILNANGSWEDFTAEGNVSEDGGKAKVNQIPTCPDCVFTFYETATFTTWNTRGVAPTVFNVNDLKEDYRDVEAYSGIGTLFLGLVLNDNNQVERAYACGVEEGIPFCVEGTKDGSKYSANNNVLNSLHSEDPSGCTQSNSGFCSRDYWVGIGESGTVQVGNWESEWFCAVFDDGMFYCGM